MFVFLPTSEKKVLPLCVVVLAVASILPLSLCHPVLLICNRSVMREGLSLSTHNAKIKAWG